MTKFTLDQLKAIDYWKEEVIETIRSALAPESTMTADDDVAAAEVIFQRIYEDGYLELPDVPNAEVRGTRPQTYVVN